MSDYDAMTEREVMQLRVLRVAYHLEDACGPNGLLGPYIAEQADIVRGLLDDLHAVSDWLEAQPAAPAPDWTTAPDWAQWWAVQPSGVAYWFRRRPMTFSDETTSQWVAHRSAPGDLCELLDTETGLQRGIDWRTTLRRRTEAQP